MSLLGIPSSSSHPAIVHNPQSKAQYPGSSKTPTKPLLNGHPPHPHHHHPQQHQQQQQQQQQQQRPSSALNTSGSANGQHQHQHQHGGAASASKHSSTNATGSISLLREPLPSTPSQGGAHHKQPHLTPSPAAGGQPSRSATASSSTTPSSSSTSSSKHNISNGFVVGNIFIRVLFFTPSTKDCLFLYRCVFSSNSIEQRKLHAISVDELNWKRKQQQH